MALHYVLDGYNIIKSDASGFLTHGSLEEQRERLIGLLAAARPQGSERNRLTVVFDGPYDSPCAEGCFPRYYKGSIEIIFSEGISADERIERLVEEELHAADAIVVTDDKGLRRMMGGSGVKFMGVAEFTKRLYRDGRRIDAGEGTSADEASIRDINSELEKRWLK